VRGEIKRVGGDNRFKRSVNAPYFASLRGGGRRGEDSSVKNLHPVAVAATENGKDFIRPFSEPLNLRSCLKRIFLPTKHAKETKKKTNSKIFLLFSSISYVSWAKS
jgi:hypothetical protein